MADAHSMSTWCRIDRELTAIKVQIRDTPDAAERLAALFEMSAPAKSRFSTAGSLALSAIASGEWLLTGSPEFDPSTVHRIAAAMRDETALVLDVTHGIIALRMEGPAATACLAAYTALDLRDAATPTGSAFRTRFGDIGVFVARTGDAPDYLLITDQSYAAYLLALIGRNNQSPR